MLRHFFTLVRHSALCTVAAFMFGCSGGGSSPAPSAAAGTWFVPEGSSITAGQVTSLFDTSQLFFTVESAAHGTGEIRGELAPATTFETDAGDPFAPNPANAPVTFATILGGDQVRPRNVVTGAKGYGSVTLDPVTRQLTGIIVTSGISGTTAHIRDGLPGSTGALVVTLEGGPVVWTVPSGATLTEQQAARLNAGTLYADIRSEAFAEGEIRGELDKQVRCASLTGASVVPAAATSATGVGFLAVEAATRQFSGFVKLSGLASPVSSAVIHVGAAGTNGTGIISLSNNGNGIWSVPANTVLSDTQVANFNNDELYFNIRTDANPGGELRGQVLKPVIRTGAAGLTGAKMVPPVSSQGSGTGTIAWNSVTGQISGSVRTAGFTATGANLLSAAGASLATLTTASPVTVAPTPGVSFALDIQPIFDANCNSFFCHATGGIGAMSLEPGLAYANTIGLVIPGNAGTSYFVSRLTGAFPPRMPLNAQPLSAANLDLIRAWIDAGALDN